MTTIQWSAKQRFAVLLSLVLLIGAAGVSAQSNIAQGKAISASSNTQTYVATNANDGSLTTYWEGAANSYPNTLTVDLGTDSSLSSVVVKLNPDPAWGTRTQTFSVLGKTAAAPSYSTLKVSTQYSFVQGTNSVSIAVSGSARYVQLSFTQNSGASAGQVAEFQVFGTQTVTQTPYGGSNRSIANNATIQAEEYDDGGQGVAYNDTTSGNSGGYTTRGDNVDIENSGDTGGTANIGWVADGEWWEYTVNATAGTYNIVARTASAGSGTIGDLQVLLDGVSLGTIQVGSTGGWQSYVDATINGIVISGGNNKVLQLKAVNGGDFNLNYVRFTTGSNPSPSPSPSPSVAPSPSPSPSVAPSPSPSPSVAPSPTPSPSGNPANLAIGKPISASSSHSNGMFPQTNANDNSLTTYWESGAMPATLTVSLGANAIVSSVVVKLNPDAAWGQRTQTIQVLGHADGTSSFNNVVSAQTYTFNPASGNSVTIAIPAASQTMSEVQLNVSSNSGAPGAQVAEFQVIGVWAPNADLIVNAISASPVSPIETSTITLTATVRNQGQLPAAASTLKFYTGTTLLGTASVPAVAAGTNVNVSANIGSLNAGSYPLTAKVDEANAVPESDNGNNSYTSPTSLVVGQVQSSDLVPTLSWNPSNPSAGNTVAFTVTLANVGNIASAGGSHAITAVLKDNTGATIQTFNGAYSGSLAAGASANVSVGSWTAVNGSYSLTTTVAVDANEVAIKQANNTSTVGFFSGRGANMPYSKIEAEAAGVTTTGTKLTPNFHLADFAGEASGRSAVHLDATGEYVEFTLSAPANAIVVRNAVAEGASGNLSVYINGVDKGNLFVTSEYAYTYATPTTLDNLGFSNSISGTAYWLYEDSNMMLDAVYPIGTKIKLQKDSGDIPWVYVDFLETENVAPAASNPDPSKYVQVSATKSIETALSEFRQDSTKLGIFIPAGTWEITSKIFLYGRATEIIGAGPWHTKLVAPTNQSNNDVGFNISSTANGTTIKNLSAWGNYHYRQNGPGKFIDGNGMQNVTLDNLWVEHFVCLYWGVGASNNTFKNLRLRNLWADGINMTNGSNNNLITNSDARAAGDDAFALFSAIDAGGSYNTGNTYSNCTATVTRRAASFAVYGGSNNQYINLYGADTLTYPGITISSLSFGLNTIGFGEVDCVFDGITLDRTGGDFYTSVGSDDHINDYQNFGAIWLFSGDRTFRNVLVKNVDINNPVYFGIMIQGKAPEDIVFQNLRFQNITINNPARYGIKLVIRAEQGGIPPRGSASFTNVVVNNPGTGIKIYGESGSPNFIVNRVSGNNW